MTPLAGLTNMEEFDFQGTSVTDLSFLKDWNKNEYLNLEDVEKWT